LLGSAGIAATGGIAGCETNGGTSESEPARQQSSPESDPTHDHGGDYLGESKPVERLDVAQLSGNRRDGDTVYYHPDQAGPYSDLEQAVADVPPGGTLQLGYGTYDVATEGRIALDHGILIRGAGWRRKPDWNGKQTPVQGTKLVNTGDDALDKPVIDFIGPGGGSWARKPTLRDLAIQHTGQSPAVRLQDIIRSLIADCFIRCPNRKSPTGVLYAKECFFARMVRTLVQDFSDTAVNVAGQGYAYEFYNNHVRSDDTALRTIADRTIIMGGEYTGKTGIAFEGAGRLDGGLVIEPGLEKNEIGVDIGGGNSSVVSGVQLYHTQITRRVETGVRFGNAEYAKYVYPNIKGLPSRSTEVAEWTGDSHNCTVITDPDVMEQCSYTVADGATNPHIHVSGAASNEQMTEWQTSLPITVDYGTDAARPVFYDGLRWRRPSIEDHSVE
jgi:hypothetical protein